MNPPPPTAQVPPAINATPSSGVVAVVDNDSQIAQVLGVWLELQGMHAACYLSGESFLQALHEESGQFTLSAGAGAGTATATATASRLAGAVLDLNLPGISGFELAATLRRLDPGLPLVIITALREEERARYGAPPPGVRCLKKPFDLDVLEDALLPLLRDATPGQ